MNKKLVLTGLCGLAFMLAVTLRADTVIIYGHVSYTDEGVKVLRGDGKAAEKTMINLPIASGDVISTSDKARCEIQADNGTIIRLDQSTEIKFETVLAQSLTSKWKITSIRLLRGNLYLINNVYKREMIQVLTANAAVKLQANSKSLIYLGSDGETQLRVLSGRVYVIYGANERSLATEKLTKGEEARITPQHRLVFEPVTDADFYLWNIGMNRNFEELHKGVSKLPKPIYRYPPALVDWAENWSSLYGKWVYNDFFGYVWQPHDERFATISYSPFYNADFVRIGGNTYMVPQEPWGWVPAYLGVWHWSDKHGWIWIPGTAFQYDYYPSYFAYYSPFGYAYYGARWLWNYWYPDLFYSNYWGSFYWSTFWYGNFGYFGNPYYWYGYDYWRYGYDPYYRGRDSNAPKRFTISADELRDPKKMPPDIGKIVSRLQELSKSEQEAIVGKMDTVKQVPLPVVRLQPTAPKSEPAQAGSRVSSGSARSTVRSVGGRTVAVGLRDWNPDAKWSRKSGYEVKLNRLANEYACPRLGITASQVRTGFDRLVLRSSSPERAAEVFANRDSGSVSRSSGYSDSSYSGSSSVSSHSGSSSSGASASSHSSSSSSGHGSVTKSKD